MVGGHLGGIIGVATYYLLVEMHHPEQTSDDAKTQTDPESNSEFQHPRVLYVNRIVSLRRDKLGYICVFYLWERVWEIVLSFEN